jgi:hypothetical protein
LPYARLHCDGRARPPRTIRGGASRRPGEYAGLLYLDFASFAECCFCELNPRTRLAMNWHVEVMAEKLAAVREGRIRRLLIMVPPRHLKSHLASIAFPVWCLGHDASAEILCVSYAQDLADKLSRDPAYRRKTAVARCRAAVMCLRCRRRKPAWSSRCGSSTTRACALSANGVEAVFSHRALRLGRCDQRSGRPKLG